MNEKTPQIKTDAAQPTTLTRNDVVLAKTLEQIYERYGKDLSAFFRDAYKEAASKASKASDVNATPYLL